MPDVQEIYEIDSVGLASDFADIDDFALCDGSLFGYLRRGTSITAFAASAIRCSEGATWNPPAPPSPYGQMGDIETLPISGGLAYIRGLVDVTKPIGNPLYARVEVFILLTNGTVITVDSHTDFYVDLGISGEISRQAVKVNGTGFFIQTLQGGFAPITHRVAVLPGSISLTTISGSAYPGPYYHAPNLTIDAATDPLKLFDFDGNVIDSLAGVFGSVFPLDSNHVIVIGGSGLGGDTSWLIQVTPLLVVQTGLIILPPTIDAQITGQPSSQFPAYVFDLFMSSRPPGTDPAWGAGTSFAGPGVVNLDLSFVELAGPGSFVTGTLGHFPSRTANVRYLSRGVGDGTICTVFRWNDGASSGIALSVWGTRRYGAPTARFTVTPLFARTPATPAFDATTSTSPLPSPRFDLNSFVGSSTFFGYPGIWDWGDASPIEGAFLLKTHLYDAAVLIATRYTVTLYVRDWFGQESPTVSHDFLLLPKAPNIQRVYPRDDAFGLGPGRVFPTPSSQQGSTKVGPAGSYV